MTLAIVTDSSADIPAELAKQYHIEVIPNLMMIGDETHIDGEGISREEFYRRLPGYPVPPTTAAPAMGVFQKAYERLIEKGASQIISIHPSGKLSAIINIATKAAETLPIPIRIFDSTSVTLGTGFQVLRAAQAAAQGCPLDEVHNWLVSLRKQARVMAVLDSLEYVRRSGRVSWVSAALGDLLGVKAIIEVREGVVHRLGLSRTRRQAVEQLIARLRRLGPLEHLAVLHTSIASQAEIEQVLASAPETRQPPFVVPITTIIGTHVGPHGLGFAAIVA